jgi:hypothetical protein
MPELREELQKLFEGNGNEDRVANMLFRNHVSAEDIPSLYDLLASKGFSPLALRAMMLLKNSKCRAWNDYLLLAEKLKCHNSAARQIINNKEIFINFPVVNSKGTVCFLNKAMIIPLEKENVFLRDSFIPDLSVISSLTGKKFFVLFEREICESSYMLAVAAALSVNNPESLDNYAFTGLIQADGMVRIPANIQEKEKCCEENGYRMIYGNFHLKSLSEWLEGRVPIPFAILLDKATRQGYDTIQKSITRAIEKEYLHFDWHLLERFFHLKREDLIVLENQPLPNDSSVWSNFLISRVKPVLVKTMQSVPGERKVLQIFGSLATLMFGAGIILRDYHPFSAYHHDNGQYYPTISNKHTPREFKRRKKEEEIETIECQIDEYRDDMIVNIYLASHNPGKDSVNYLSSQGIEAGTANISLITDQGALDVNKSWNPYINDLYNQLNTIVENTKRIHLFLSCPVVIAFALGTVVTDYWDMKVYQFIRGEKSYFKAFETKDL